jgi:hypothetical protein
MTEKMKESTRIFAEKQCTENRARMAREANGDYGIPIHIVSSYNEPSIPMSAEHRSLKSREE